MIDEVEEKLLEQDNWSILYQKQAYKKLVRKRKNLNLKIIKNIAKAIFNLLCIPFFLIFMVFDDIRLKILDYFDSDEIC